MPRSALKKGAFCSWRRSQTPLTIIILLKDFILLISATNILKISGILMIYFGLCFLTSFQDTSMLYGTRNRQTTSLLESFSNTHSLQGQNKQTETVAASSLPRGTREEGCSPQEKPVSHKAMQKFLTHATGQCVGVRPGLRRAQQPSCGPGLYPGSDPSSPTCLLWLPTHRD